ncbi:TraM recognition domain-containing protein, partial [Bacillus velezensis]|uniref:TraM recognition domain-containing protein n=1 Tax=Bacillus velezensis TaxID=492670 RepID=UPI002FFE50BA
SINLERIGFGEKRVKGKAEPNALVKVTFSNGTTQETIANRIGSFTIPIPSSRVIDVKEKIQIETMSLPNDCEEKISSSKSKTIIEIVKRDEETEVRQFEYKKRSTIRIEEIVYFDKPVAIFMVVPDHDSSNHVIASIFTRQLYFVLAKKSTLSTGKCTREVVFLLDEAGNMPAIEGFTNIITVCLGRNIRFNLIFQHYAQIQALYGKGEATIRGNCGNQIYILSNDQDTKERFSKMLGEKTQMVYSRSGEHLSTKKTRTESIESRRLLLPEELNFQEGEMVISRVIKRQDLQRRKITPYPIFNSGPTALKFRFEYLAEDFDTTLPFISIPIPSLHRDVDLME